jgi:hypothetical protein
LAGSAVLTGSWLYVQRGAAQILHAQSNARGGLRVSRVTGAGMSVLRLPGQQGALTGNLLKDGHAYAIVEQHLAACNSRHQSLERLLSGGCLHGSTCLAFEGLFAPDGCGSDRIEVKLADSERDSALRFGESRYLRFSLRVDPGVHELKKAALISQVWQASSVAVGRRPALGPVFAISIAENHRDSQQIDVDFRYRNEVSALNPPHPFATYPIKRDEWHTFHVQMTPRHVGHPDGPGEILVWVEQGLHAELESTRALNYSAIEPTRYQFYWGYPPDPSTSLGSRFDVRVGLYRPEPMTFVKFWLDDVKLTNDKAQLAGP